MKALIISADNFEDSELLVPYYRLKEAGIEVAVASLSRDAIKGKYGYEMAVDKTLDEVKPDDYAILILPGGTAPALVRKEPKALEIARSFFARNKKRSARRLRRPQRFEIGAHGKLLIKKHNMGHS